MSWLTRLARALTGPPRELVGADRFGNVYYVVRKKLVDPLAAPPRGVTWHELRKREERHVDWKDGGSRCGSYSPEQLPVEWSSWLNFRRAEPPLAELPDAALAAERLAAHAQPEADALAARAAQLAPSAAAESATVPAAAAAPAAVEPRAAPAARDAAPAAEPVATPSAVDALRDGGYRPSGFQPAAQPRRRGGRGSAAPPAPPAGDR